MILEVGEWMVLLFATSKKYEKVLFILHNWLSSLINVLSSSQDFTFPCVADIRRNNSHEVTLYKLYAVPVRACSTREDMHYPWVISSVPVSHILSTREGMHYPWVISSVPVSHILSTREDMQYPSVILSVPVSHILSTREDMQYPWVNLYEWRMNETSRTGAAYPHRYCIPSRVLRIWRTGTEYPHWYWEHDSRVLHILTDTEDMTHGY